jgi:uncharacterized FlgJ-related protein
MKLVISESQLKKIIEQSVVGAPNYGTYDNKNIYNFNNKDKNVEKTDIKPFSLENLKSEIIKQGIKYPNIVLAQAFWESKHFRSHIFTENNNLFGMKRPRVRKSVATGENFNHATYNNWVDSVRDYKLMQDELGYSSLDVDGYFKKLDTDYCPGCNYSKNIKSMIKYNQKKGIKI